MEVNRCFGCMEETRTYPCPHCGYDPKVRKPQDYTLRPGTILHGKYLVGAVLGQGGFGITYIGLDLALERKVAIKEYFPSAHVTRHHGAGNDLQWYITDQARAARISGQEMFLKEARKMNRVSSIPQVVEVRDLFQENETAYIVMDFIEGETLKQRVERTGPLSWNAAGKLLLPVVEAMEQVHQAGLIHRDLSPDNLMLQPKGGVKILDLGAAKDLNLNTGASSMQVAKGGFSPLEQYVQRGGSGSWTDVYSLAATMYYALTGVLPPTAIDRMDNDTLRWDLPQLLTLPPNVIRALKKAMALRPKDRTQTMAEFSVNLRTNAAKSAEPAKPAKESGKTPKKHGKALALAAAAALVVVLACVGLFFRNRNEPANSVSTDPVSEQQTVQAPEQETAAESQVPWGGNVLMASAITEDYRYDEELAPVLGSGILRAQIRRVTFLDSLADAPSDSWDVSEAGDGSVQAWMKQNGTVSVWMDSKFTDMEAYDLWIAAEGGINGKNCAELFCGYQNVVSISFNGCFHTDYAESMEYMFCGCAVLTELNAGELKTSRVRSMKYMFSSSGITALDLSGFDTANVENMAGMFAYSSDILSLDLRSFDTGKVTDMGDMFSCCTVLKDVDVSSFDTANVTDMSFMFTYCDIEELDLRNFDTANVESMAYMFSGDDKLISVDLRNWNTAQVSSMMGMFKSCTSLRAVRGIESLDTSNVQSYDEFMDDGVQINGEPWRNMFA